MKFLGIDPSITSTGLSCVTLHEGKVRLLGSKSASPDSKPRDYQDRFHRYRELIGKIVAFVDDQEPDLICIEGYSYASRGRATLTLPEFGGLLRYFLIRKDYAIIEVAPTRLKKFVLKGNSSKEDVHKRLKRHLGCFSGLSQEDILDASVAAVFAMAVSEKIEGQDVGGLDPFDFTTISDTLEALENSEGALDQNGGFNI